MKGILGVFVLCFLGLTTAYIVPEPLRIPKLFSPKGECSATEGEFPILLPDTEDPTIFYICAHGLPVMKKCPLNMVFDPDLKVCVRKENTAEHPETFSPNGECPAVDKWFPVYLTDTEDPSVFYECSNGVPIRQKCPDGLIFNPIINVCIRKQYNVFKNSIAPFAPKGKCPPVNGEYPVFLPDDEDPTIYYECNGGHPIKMKCPVDLIFDPNLNVCVHRKLVLF